MERGDRTRRIHIYTLFLFVLNALLYLQSGSTSNWEPILYDTSRLSASGISVNQFFVEKAAADI